MRHIETTRTLKTPRGSTFHLEINSYTPGQYHTALRIGQMAVPKDAPASEYSGEARTMIYTALKELGKHSHRLVGIAYTCGEEMQTFYESGTPHNCPAFTLHSVHVPHYDERVDPEPDTMHPVEFALLQAPVRWEGLGDRTHLLAVIQMPSQADNSRWLPDGYIYEVTAPPRPPAG